MCRVSVTLSSHSRISSGVLAASNFFLLLPELVNERIGFVHKISEDTLQFRSSNRDIAPVRVLDGVFQHIHGGELGANFVLDGHSR